MTDEPAETLRSAFDDLYCWAKTGVAPTNLQECEALAQVIKEELGIQHTLSPGRGIALLHKALDCVIAQAREQAIAQAPKEFSPKDNPVFQIAAAAELLGLHNSEAFSKLCRLRGPTDDEWQDLRKKPGNRGDQNLRYLRACAWIGRTSAKTGRRWQAKLVKAVEAALILYLPSRKARQELAELLAETTNDAILVQQNHAVQPTDLPASDAALPADGHDERSPSDRFFQIPPSDSPSEAPPGISERLRRLSRQLGEDLDIASGQSGSQPEVRLSTGLYITRRQQQFVISELAAAKDGAVFILSGDSGHGKSSLLWGMYRDLMPHTRLVPFLINAPWLRASVDQNLATSARLTLDDLILVVRDLLHRGRNPALLIDTADLLLHSEPDRVNLLDLCDTLTDEGALLVLASRPEEAQSLPRGRYRHVGLQAYDDIELPQAIERHVQAFCPDAQPRALEDKVSLILNAVARGLPVREVCRSPLQLRLLFEVHAPEFPSLELDVSGLYERYWERRIASDQRTEASRSTYTTAEADLSLTAEQVAVALLANGRTELDDNVLIRSARAVADSWFDSRESAGKTVHQLRALTDAVATLRQRGVLLSSQDSTHFFHQTMFEYAAARGLYERDGSAAIDFLVAHVTSHPEDLFVGAVLEQLLILASRDPIVRSHVESVLDIMTTTNIVPLQRVSLAVLAHRPELGSLTGRLIEAAEPGAVRRFALIAPSVAAADTSQLVSLLIQAWHRSEYCRLAVLEAFERLTARGPAPVLAAVKELACRDAVLHLPRDAAPAIQLYGRVVCGLGVVDSVWSAGELAALLDATLGKSISRDVPLYILQLVVDNWASVGSQWLVMAVRDRVVSAQENRDKDAGKMRDRLGQILARSWMEEFQPDVYLQEWYGLVDRVCIALEADDYAVLANAELIGIAYYLLMNPEAERLWHGTLDRLLALSSLSAPFALARAALPILFSSPEVHSSPYGARLARLLAGLPAPANSPPAGPPMWSAVVRLSLHNATMPTQALASLLSSAPAANDPGIWLRDDGLVQLLVKAALGGHAIASETLDNLRRDISSLSEIGMKILSYALPDHVDEAPELIEMLVELSVARRTGVALFTVLEDPSKTVVERLGQVNGRLQVLLNALLTDRSAMRQREGAALWLELDRHQVLGAPTMTELNRRVCVATVPSVIGNLLKLGAQAAIDGKLPEGLVCKLLEEHFELRGNPLMVATPGRKNISEKSMMARSAWLELYCKA